MTTLAFRLAIPTMCAALALTGCAKESPPGGPGATTTPAPNGNKTYTSDAAKENTFTLKVPGTDVHIDQGETDEVTVSIDRGDDFKQKVAVAITTPEGVTATPNKFDIMPGETEFKVTLAAGATAPVGPGNVKVDATPETGTAVSQSFKVDIKKDAGDTATPANPPVNPPDRAP